jgi:hypothetical protein
MSVIFKIIVSVLKRPEGESVLTTIIDVSKITTTFSVECKKEVKNTKPKDEKVKHLSCPVTLYRTIILFESHIKNIKKMKTSIPHKWGPCL